MVAYIYQNISRTLTIKSKYILNAQSKTPKHVNGFVAYCRSITMHPPKLHIRIPAHAPGVVSRPSSLIVSENTKGEQWPASPLPAVLSLMSAQVPEIPAMTTNDHSLKR